MAGYASLARPTGYGLQLVKLYDEAKTYIDGKWLTIAISSENDLHDVTELLTMKRLPTSSSSASRSSRKASNRRLIE